MIRLEQDPPQTKYLAIAILSHYASWQQYLLQHSTIDTNTTSSHEHFVDAPCPWNDGMHSLVGLLFTMLYLLFLY